MCSCQTCLLSLLHWQACSLLLALPGHPLVLHPLHPQPHGFTPNLTGSPPTSRAHPQSHGLTPNLMGSPPTSQAHPNLIGSPPTSQVHPNLNPRDWSTPGFSVPHCTCFSFNRSGIIHRICRPSARLGRQCQQMIGTMHGYL